MISYVMLRFVCFALLLAAVFVLQASDRGDTADIEAPAASSSGSITITMYAVADE